MEWARILAYITGTVDQELILRQEYLAAENRILKAQLQGRLRLSDAQRARLGEVGDRLGRKALGEGDRFSARPILGWYRRLVARKFDGSRLRRPLGRPPISKEIQELIVRMAPGKIGPGANPRGWRWHVFEIEPATRGQDIVVRRASPRLLTKPRRYHADSAPTSGSRRQAALKLCAM